MANYYNNYQSHYHNGTGTVTASDAKEYIVFYAHATSNTKNTGHGNGATLQPGTYVLNSYICSKDVTVWNDLKVDGKVITSTPGIYEFTITTESSFAS